MVIRQRGTRDAVMGIRWTFLHVLFLSYLVAIAASASSTSASASNSISSSLTSSPQKTAAAIATSASAAMAAVKSSASSATVPGIHSSATATAKGTLGKFYERTLQHQRKLGEYHSHSKRHDHLEFIRKNWGSDSARSTANNNYSNSPYSIWFYMRVGLAGGLAGASGTAVLYPMDAAKTLRQSQPETYKNVRHALRYLCVTKTTPPPAAASSAAAAAAASSAAPHYAWHIQRAYVGWLPAVVGAIPSSALYFGAYESMKRFITRQTTKSSSSSSSSLASSNQGVEGFWHRLGIHATAAASGNVLSSMVFVPKELVKQQMQFQGSGVSFGDVLLQILKKSGVPGLYCGYQATLMRNIPSAMLRFALYEEFKYRWYTTNQAGGDDSILPGDALPFSWQLFAAGACAGALASGIMTPVDVLKTRLSTGTCPVGVKNCVLHIVSEQGWKGMYAGAGSRVIWSGAFSAIGFGSFEAAKNLLGVPDNNAGTIEAKASPPRSNKNAPISTRHQRRLDHALSDGYGEKTETRTR